MSGYIWDGPADPDEEIADLLPYKNDFENNQLGVKYSKNGIIGFIEKFMAFESPDNTNDTKNAKLWH